MRWRSMRCGLLTLGMAIGVLQPASGDAPVVEPSSKSPEVGRLIRQLADRDFATRQAAERRLLSLGHVALSPVEAAATSSDPELRIRARRLAIQLRDHCFEQRLAAFVRGRRGLSSETLPGWEEFQELAGDAHASRRVFAEIYEADPQLFNLAFAESNSVDGDTNHWRLPPTLETRAIALQRALSTRRNRKQDRQQAVAAALAIHFIAAANPASVTPRTAQSVTQLARSELVKPAKDNDALAGAIRSVMTTWIVGSQTEDLYALSQMLKLAEQLKLRDAVPFALAIATGERAIKPNQAQFRARALLMVGKLGNQSHLHRLEPLLDDQAVCASQSGRAGRQAVLLDVEIRDVALAVMLHLAGEEPGAFGFAKALAHSDRLFALHTLAFRTKIDRDEALAAWRSRPNISDAASVRLAGQEFRQLR